jgi:hypothetical protein
MKKFFSAVFRIVFLPSRHRKQSQGSAPGSEFEQDAANRRRASASETSLDGF